ncbi:Acylphosphatase [Pelotomaculum schinkii]|uniref:acylphosphatase n=1 Tax=Pelotomaculum schinkii TaxID=78350 RepID=A0A4Y7R8Q7_9FIRM|nr:acylphosphatase [Pelotomaculum schinkii]TEB05344.1 Acylphosphatase [Pelotomaculum schinkii]
MPQAVRAHLIVTGLVQGVYYRATARQEARTLNITGWVKNRTDGAVEAVIEGDRVKVLKFIDWCRQGPPASQVRGVQVEWGDFRGEYQDFSIVS